MAKTFEELNVYQKARQLTNEVYTLTRKSSFSRDFGLVDQVRRASISVMSNIAEGFERGTRPEFIRFLFISKGSCGEIRAQLEIAKDQGYLSESEHIRLRESTKMVSGMLSNLITSVKKAKGSPRKS